jgi:hypothetical protein
LSINGYWLLDIQTCSAQQRCDIIYRQTRNIVLNLNRSLRLVERDFSHAVHFTDAPDCRHLVFSWRNSILKSYIH